MSSSIMTPIVQHVRENRECVTVALRVVARRSRHSRMSGDGESERDNERQRASDHVVSSLPDFASACSQKDQSLRAQVSS
jgi:hypothetical protein